MIWRDLPVVFGFVCLCELCDGYRPAIRRHRCIPSPLRIGLSVCLNRIGHLGCLGVEQDGSVVSQQCLPVRFGKSESRGALMRASLFRTAFCLILATAFASTADAGVRGKPASAKPATPKSSAPAAPQKRVAQATNEYSSVKPVPLPADPVHNETVINETVVNETVADTSHANCHCGPTVTKANTNTNTIFVPVPMPMMFPMMVPQQPVMQVMATPGCSTCGGGGGGMMNPAATAAYGQAFPNGFYRGGAEAGMYHFPYYSYRRPWYYPGQPSFHRSTDLVW